MRNYEYSRHGKAKYGTQSSLEVPKDVKKMFNYLEVLCFKKKGSAHLEKS